MTYEDYMNTIFATNGNDFTYYGIALAGNKKKINKLTGSLALLR